MGIKVDDLPDNIRCFAGYAGLTAAVKLVELFGGETLYLPKLESVVRPKRDRAIQDF